MLLGISSAEWGQTPHRASLLLGEKKTNKNTYIYVHRHILIDVTNNLYLDRLVKEVGLI